MYSEPENSQLYSIDTECIFNIWLKFHCFKCAQLAHTCILNARMEYRVLFFFLFFDAIFALFHSLEAHCVPFLSHSQIQTINNGKGVLLNEKRKKDQTLSIQYIRIMGWLYEQQ